MRLNHFPAAWRARHAGQKKFRIGGEICCPPYDRLLLTAPKRDVFTLITDLFENFYDAQLRTERGDYRWRQKKLKNQPRNSQRRRGPRKAPLPKRKKAVQRRKGNNLPLLRSKWEERKLLPFLFPPEHRGRSADRSARHAFGEDDRPLRNFPMEP